MRRAVDVREVDDREIGLAVGGREEQRADRGAVEAVARGRIAPGGRCLLRRPEHVGRPLSPRDGGEEMRDLRLAEHAHGLELGRRLAGHREERLHLDERRIVELLGGGLRHATPVGVAGDPVRGRIRSGQQRDVIRVRPRRHDGVRRREHRRPLGRADGEVEESRHPDRGREARVEPVDHDQIDVGPLGPRGADDEQHREDARESTHPGRVDRRGRKS